MTKTLVPTYKIGTPFQSPSWRYQAINYPEKFGFEWLCSRRAVDAGHLNRLITKGLRPASTYTMPTLFKELMPTLPSHLAGLLIKTWNKHYFREHRHKVDFNSTTTSRIPISWNIDHVKLLNDDFLKKMIFHFFNYKHDKNIEEAVQFYNNPQVSEQVKWLKYGFYGKMTDVELAKMWKRPTEFITALRLMFFDFSHWPDNRLVHFSLIRQMKINRELDDEDYHVFRRVYDLGMLGIKAMTDFANLTNEEESKVNRFMKDARIDNMLDIYYTISSTKDAVTFNRAANELSLVALKKIEIEQKGKLLELSASKLSKEMGMNEESTIHPEEAELLIELREMAKFDHTPNFPSFLDIKADEQKLLVEKSS